MLNDVEIKAWAERNVVPLDLQNLNPASIDLRLGNTLRKTKWYWKRPFWPLTWKIHKIRPLQLWGPEIEFEKYTMRPGEFLLTCSMEKTFIPEDFVSILLSKSSTGRMGIEHLHSGFGDPGFNGKWTWELVNVAPWPVEICAGQRLMQLVLAKLVSAPERMYDGRYQNQEGPTPARPDHN